ncbi:MAG: rhomboid family intramembrane serine protease, partial [Planctomycetota bacterium]|nr:rhomboid family intramembrane serine protease [Planctomycetota bacterium]
SDGYQPQEGHGRGGLMFPQLTPGVKWLMIACGAVQLVQFITEGALSSWLGLSIQNFGTFPLLGLVNIATYQFVHSYVSLGHILMNMLVLYFFGTMVEEMIGTRRFLWLYLLSGVAGGLFWLVFSGTMGIPEVEVVGASGCCYGVLTYAACRNPNSRVIFVIVFIRLWWLAAILGVIALYNVGTQLRGGFPGGVADSAHLGGVLYALVYWRFGDRFSGVGERLAARASERGRRQRAARAQELDRLLAKINDVGMTGLTDSERKFLKKYSQQGD